MCNTVIKHRFARKTSFIFIQSYVKLKFKKVTLSLAQSELKNKTKTETQNITALFLSHV